MLFDEGIQVRAYRWIYFDITKKVISVLFT